VPEKSVKPVGRRAARGGTKAARARKIDQAEIARRAYFIYLDEGRTDELENWLRAERELAAA
jgi:hypothetical protein